MICKDEKQWETATREEDVAQSELLRKDGPLKDSQSEQIGTQEVINTFFVFVFVFIFLLLFLFLGFANMKNGNKIKI